MKTPCQLTSCAIDVKDAFHGAKFTFTVVLGHPHFASISVRVVRACSPNPCKVIYATVVICLSRPQPSQRRGRSAWRWRQWCCCLVVFQPMFVTDNLCATSEYVCGLNKLFFAEWFDTFVLIRDFLHALKFYWYKHGTLWHTTRIHTNDIFFSYHAYACLKLYRFSRQFSWRTFL